MKVILRNIKFEHWMDAAKTAKDWHKWHNKDGWQKHKTTMDSRFVIHETETGTIVVNYKKD
jgi:hypothetical protein